MNGPTPAPTRGAPERIVVGVDFSESSVAAARWVREAFAPHAELVLVHAIELAEPPAFLRGYFPSAEVVEATAREGAEKRLREMRGILPPGRVWTDVRRGRASECLAATAREYGGGLVVIGTHRERPGLWSRIGTTAERVIALSPAPVLLATGVLGSAPTHLLVPVDDSPTLPHLLSVAGGIARAHHARVTTIHVVPSSTLSYMLAGAGPNIGAVVAAPLDPANLLSAESDRWLKALLDAGFDRAMVASEVTFGDAGQEILAAAERHGADLIVIGRSGSGGIRRALLGSVTRKVLRDSLRPVLVVVGDGEGGG